MANFKTAVNKVMSARIEGGYQDNPADTGNYSCGVLAGTNMGISAIALEDYYGYCVSKSDSLNLTPTEAQAIYKVKYWDVIRGDQIKNQSIADLIFDAYVNQTGWVKTMMAETFKQLGINVPVKIPFTNDMVSAINNTNGNDFFTIFKAQREEKYHIQAEKGANYEFKEGWLKRLSYFDFSTVKTGLKWAFAGGIIFTLSFLLYKQLSK